MMRYRQLGHEFVRHIPVNIEPGILYVSMEFATAAHRCCCGCGEEIITPFTPTDWKMTFDGESVSLAPSIGNWNLACRSHYVIRGGEVLEAGPWSEPQIAAERLRDRMAKANYYGTPVRNESLESALKATTLKSDGPWKRLWKRLWG